MDNLNVSLALIVAIIAIGACLFFVLRRREKKISTVIILDKIKEINEFAAHEISYYKNVSYEEPPMKIFNHDIPFTRKEFSINMLGKIKIGINMENMTVSVINKSLFITIPEIRILSHETRVSDSQIKNPKFDLAIFNEKIEEMKRIEEEAILQDTGVVEQAYDALKKNITNSLMLFPKIGKKLVIHYRTEMPVLVDMPHLSIEDKGESEEAPS